MRSINFKEIILWWRPKKLKKNLYTPKLTGAVTKLTGEIDQNPLFFASRRAERYTKTPPKLNNFYDEVSQVFNFSINLVKIKFPLCASENTKISMH